jgi:Flp pilus assembly protein TadG
MLEQKQLHIHERERGQSFVELAVSLILLFWILAGAVDIGRAYFAIIALRDAAQEGVIYASINPIDVTGIEDRVRQSSSNPIDFSSFPSSDIDVTWNKYGSIYPEDSPPTPVCADFYSVGGSQVSNSVTVTVNYDLTISAPLISAIFPGGVVTLSIDDEHTILKPQCP